MENRPANDSPAPVPSNPPPAETYREMVAHYMHSDDPRLRRQAEAFRVALEKRHLQGVRA